MNETISRLLKGNADNHMLPFFWQHGEDEETLRKYMAVIQEANCHAVCVESRPHPDFCGDKWWEDMDIILDEARKRNMKVWILDDSHFPTGFANGALKNKPDALCKQNIFMTQQVLRGDPGVLSLDLRAAGLLEMSQEKFTAPARVFHNDSILFVTARNADGETFDLTDYVTNEKLCWDKPAGNWTVQVGIRSGNTGSRRDYINVTEEESCRVLIDAVYEPHWQHYADDFGKTIAGFFSDEPELGNGVTYAKGNLLGTDQDLPWGKSMEVAVSGALGENWRVLLPLLWTEGEDASRVRSIYMDCLTKLVRKAFSCQLGGWCRDHGVKYIGHIIEDDAYEVDGLGNANLMDDANVPSLLALPYMEVCGSEDELYRNTRAFVLSRENPYFYQGKFTEGIGSPHTPRGYIWPIALCVQAMTSTDTDEIALILHTLMHTHGGTGFMHESFDPEAPEQFTRSWFAWANSMFAEMIYRLHEGGRLRQVLCRALEMNNRS